MYSAVKLTAVIHFSWALTMGILILGFFFKLMKKLFSFLVDTAVLELIQLVPPGIVSVFS